MPADFEDTWESGVYVGNDSKSFARVTIQLPQLYVASAPHNERYASWVFPQLSQPKELPNVQSVSWDRDPQSGVGSCTLRLYNQSPLPIGQRPEPSGRLDRPGYYTYNRGHSPYADRWNQMPNEWQGYLVYDRIVRVYEGYGFDPSVPPELDPHLVKTGTWMIHYVDYDTDPGMIIVTMRDNGGLLVDDVAFPPVVPLKKYPLAFSKYQTVPGPDHITIADSGWHHPRYRTDSGYAGGYVGRDASIYGHKPSHAFDSSDTSYWLSIGNDRPSADYSYEYVEGTVSGSITGVRVHAWGGPYRMYVGVYAAGKWQGRLTVPYNANDIVSAPNGANVRYVTAATIGENATLDIKFAKPIPSATRLRITLTHLTNSGKGQYPYRGGLRDVKYTGEVITHTPTTRTIGNYGDYCLDEQTEVLTKRGWLRYDEIAVGDEVFSVDPNSGLSQWDAVTNVYRRRRRRSMVRMESQTHSSLSTANHRWLVYDSRGELGWRTTGTLRNGDRIMRSAPRSDAPTEKKYDDAFVELVGWWWTEGYRKVAGGQIGQSVRVNPEKVERIRGCLRQVFGESGALRRSARVHPSTVQRAAALRATGMSWLAIGQEVGVSGKTVKAWEADGWTPWALWRESKPRPNGVVLFDLAELAVRDLDQVAPGRVLATDFLAALTSEQLGLLIETSLDADGWRRQDGHAGISQASEDRIKAFEIACALAGRPTSTHRHGAQWVTTLLKKNVFWPQACRVSSEPYDGVVWCPTTARTGTWLARRNGSVYFTGNTDVIKRLLAYGGFWWPRDHAKDVIKRSDGSVQSFPCPDNDPYLGLGRIWGDLQSTGTAGVVPLTIDMFDKKPLMDCINAIKDIIGFIFMVDEDGAAIWRSPNVWRAGNVLGDLATNAGWTPDIITIDERNTLIGLQAKVTGQNVREHIVVANTSGRIGAVAKGHNPYPTNKRRTAGWTDQHFGSTTECQIMADLIGLRQFMTMRQDTVTIPGHPGIQCDDQVRIIEEVTGEGYLHYVDAIHSDNNLETGRWTYQLTTNWLGDSPDTLWLWNSSFFADSTKEYLQALGQVPSFT
jgi:hypothetical protein